MPTGKSRGLTVGLPISYQTNDTPPKTLGWSRLMSESECLVGVHFIASGQEYQHFPHFTGSIIIIVRTKLFSPYRRITFYKANDVCRGLHHVLAQYI